MAPAAVPQITQVLHAKTIAQAVAMEREHALEANAFASLDGVEWIALQQCAAMDMVIAPFQARASVMRASWASNVKSRRSVLIQTAQDMALVSWVPAGVNMAGLV